MGEVVRLKAADDHEFAAYHVAASGEPIMIDDIRASRDPQAMGSSLACVPLVLEERVVGTLTLFDKIIPLGTERRLFSIDDLDMLFALSSQIAAEIEDIRLTGRLQELVRKEKYQGSQLRALYSRSQAFLQSISDALLAVDRDGFVEEINTVGLRILGVEAKKTTKFILTNWSRINLRCASGWIRAVV